MFSSSGANSSNHSHQNTGLPTDLGMIKPMHSWESQEKLLQDYYNQEVKDCLQYVDFRFSKHEWDNIPGILPRFMFYLSKYVSGLSGFCKHVSQQESTESIRADLNLKYKVTLMIVGDFAYSNWWSKVSDRESRTCRRRS